MGSPSASSSKKIPGSPLTSWPISMSSGLIGVPSTSWTTRMPFVQIVLLSLSPGSGPRSRSGDDRGQAEQAHARRAASCGSADGGRCPDSSVPSGEDADGLLAVLGDWRTPGCRNSTISWSPISLRAHWMVPTPMHSRARPEGRPEGDVGGAEAEDDVGVVADVEDEVGDAEQQREDRREPEERGDLALGALLGGLVDVGRARAGAPGGPGRRSARSRPVASSCLSLMPSPPSSLERVVLAAIQTATPTGRRCRRARRTGPRETGTERAEREAAVVGRLLVLLQVGDDLALVLGGEHRRRRRPASAAGR